MRRVFLNCTAALLLALLLPIAVGSQDKAEEKTAKLIVVVLYEDIDNTPANDVYVSVQGYPRTVHFTGTTTLLGRTGSGRYEASLPPGLYDIFVSEPISIPQCRRVELEPGQEEFWKVKLESDYKHLTK